MTNNLFSIIQAPGRRQAPCANPHIAELREVFALACHFGLTSAERDEWQVRFDQAVAALEAEIAGSKRRHTTRGAGWRC
jgi:hypothetical protein